jgi:hypothetical protein
MRAGGQTPSLNSVTSCQSTEITAKFSEKGLTVRGMEYSINISSKISKELSSYSPQTPMIQLIASQVSSGGNSDITDGKRSLSADKRSIEEGEMKHK